MTRAGIAARLRRVPAALALAAGAAASTPLPHEEVVALCADADGLAGCGRRVEARQLARFPGIAARDGDTLTIRVRGEPRRFTDRNERTYAVWGFLQPIDGVVLYVVKGEQISLTLLLRATGAEAELANEPVLSPDASRIATADFCSDGCDNEIAVWRVTEASVRKERFYRPRTEWLDVSVRWKNDSTLLVERRTAAVSAAASFEFRLTDPGWMRVEPR